MAHGSSTLLEVIDQLARRTPDTTWAQFPESAGAFEDGHLKTVTFAHVANAINRLAHYLTVKIPDAGDLETTICYLGPSDVRYFVMALAACRCRIKLLLSSPRNNLEAHQSLFCQTQCRTLVGPKEACGTILEACAMDHVDIPTLDELFDPELVPEYPWHRSFAEVAHEPFVILHTSGSTGLPKVVEVKHGLVAAIDAQQNLASIDGRRFSCQMWENRSIYISMPPFHSAAFNFLAYSVFQGTRLVFGPCEQPPSIATVEQMLELNVTTAGVMPPSLLAEVSREPDILQKLSNWDSVAFGGGPLEEEAVKALWQHTRIIPILGSTETFNLPEFLPQSEDEAQYHAYHPALGIEFRKSSGKLHELVFVRKAELSKQQGAFATFPDLQEYSMKDLYDEHPSKAGLWRYRGRLDDILVLGTGEKFNPRDAERIVAAESGVKAALVVGTGEDQPALLIEPSQSAAPRISESQDYFSEALDHANGILPSYAKIHPTHIRVVKPNGFLHSSKGETRRAATVELLQEQIVEIYANADSQVGSQSHLDFSSTQNLATSMSCSITSELLSGKPLDPNDDIFSRGIDSLGVLRLTRLIKGQMQVDQLPCASRVSPKLIYRHRTPAGIASRLSELIDDGDSASPAPSDDKQHWEMQEMLDSCLQQIPETPAAGASASSPTQQVFLLTGSTGSLGSYLLDAVLQLPSTTKVICLNRPGGTASRQAKIQRDRGLSDDISGVDFLQGTIADKNFGLDDECYLRLQKEVTHIIHNAWHVNFNLPLSAYQDHLQACCHLISLAHSSPNRVALTFLSSVGAANHWAQAGHTDPVPETKLDDFDAAEPVGYAQSKFLAEHLFSAASERLNLPVLVCRLGQVAGPVSSGLGMWNPHEWFPSIILSAKLQGLIPDNLAAMNSVDWVPVDLLAVILAEIVSSQSSQLPEDGESPPKDAAHTFTRPVSPTTAFRTSTPLTTPGTGLASPDTQVFATFLNFVNPYSIFWEDLAPSVASLLGDNVRVVPFSDWKADLSAKMEINENEEVDLPAAKLIDFFEDISRKESRRPTFSLEGSLGASRKMRELQPVSIEWLKTWVHQWEESMVTE